MWKSTAPKISIERPLIATHVCVQQLSRSVSDSFGQCAITAVALGGAQDLSADEIEELRKRLDEKQRALGKKKKGQIMMLSSLDLLSVLWRATWQAAMLAA